MKCRFIQFLNFSDIFFLGRDINVYVCEIMSRQKYIVRAIVIQMAAILNFLQIFVLNIIVTSTFWQVQVQYKTSQVKSINIYNA